MFLDGLTVVLECFDFFIEFADGSLAVLDFAVEVLKRDVDVVGSHVLTVLHVVYWHLQLVDQLVLQGLQFVQWFLMITKLNCLRKVIFAEQNKLQNFLA